MNSHEENQPAGGAVAKSCAYCGKENTDEAAFCMECGNAEFKAVLPPAPQSPLQTPPIRKLTFAEVVADPVKLFRLLVVIAHGCYFLSVLVPFVDYRFMAYETAELLNHGGLGAWIQMPPGIYWLTAGLYLPIAVGLYQFSASARLAFTSLTLGFALLSLFFGVLVVPPHVAFLSWVVTSADGAIFLLAYSSPLNDKFR